MTLITSTNCVLSDLHQPQKHGSPSLFPAFLTVHLLASRTTHTRITHYNHTLLNKLMALEQAGFFPFLPIDDRKG